MSNGTVQYQHISRVYSATVFSGFNAGEVLDYVLPDNSKVYRSLQNCGYSAWNLLHVILLAP